MVSAAESAFGHLDILVNNAGFNIRKPALEVTWEDWNIILDTNLRGSFLWLKPLPPHDQHAKYGRIINIGSVTSVAGYAGLAPYGASRGGIRQLTMSLADDWGKHGITVNCLAPGWFRTEQNKALYESPGVGQYLSNTFPSSVPANPMISTAPSSFWLRSPAATSPAKPFWLTAASPPEPCAPSARATFPKAMFKAYHERNFSFTVGARHVVPALYRGVQFKPFVPRFYKTIRSSLRLRHALHRVRNGFCNCRLQVLVRNTL